MPVLDNQKGFPRFQLATRAKFDSHVAKPEFACLFDGYERRDGTFHHG